jgi:dTMP kinase
MTTQKLVSIDRSSSVGPQPARGKFISFEGMDGSGKSTQILHLASTLRRLGIAVVLTREPGGTPLGESIRALLLDVNNEAMQPTAELALMFASRAQLVATVIEPALKRGEWVLCDRFVDSSEAYQGGGRELGSELVLVMQQALLGGRTPDLTILLDHDIGESVTRARARSIESEGKESRFESEGYHFFKRVRETFRRIAARDKQRVFLIDARRPIHVIHKEIVAEVSRRFPLHIIAMDLPQPEKQTTSMTGSVGDLPRGLIRM